LNHPLAEVFGFRADDFSPNAVRHRQHRLCPFNNKVPNCTKDKANDPLGTCSIYDADGKPVITCPIRFRQDWIIADHAADFFFPTGTNWTSLTEVRLNDKHGKSAGNIDVVLVAYDDQGRITDFGSLEVQAVYISGNVTNPFKRYMADPEANHNMNWRGQPLYPRPDFLSSTRKRLAPQLLYKGGILKAWDKKQAVAVDQRLWSTLPNLAEADPAEADMVWLIYDLVPDKATGRYQLTLHQTSYTLFNPSLARLATAEPGSIELFTASLQSKLNQRLDGENNPPDAPTLFDMFETEE
jgi:hypothetical protein